MSTVRSPVPVDDDRFFWNAVAAGRLLFRRCARCDRWQHPPTPMCPECGSLHWTEQEVSGAGTVHTWIVARHPTEPDDEPRLVAVIALAEGLRLVSNLIGVAPAHVVNDMPVELAFADVDGVQLPQFRPSAAR